MKYSLVVVSLFVLTSCATEPHISEIKSNTKQQVSDRVYLPPPPPPPPALPTPTPKPKPKQQVSAEMQRAKLIFDPMSEQELIEIAKQDAITNTNLKDPSSATFKNVRVVRKTDRKLVCGEINAKNSFGAYVGYQPFIWGYLREVSILNPNPRSAAEQFAFTTLMKGCL